MKILRSLVRILSPSCRQAARLQSEALLAVYITDRLEHDLNSANVLRALRQQMIIAAT